MYITINTAGFRLLDFIDDGCHVFPVGNCYSTLDEYVPRVYMTCPESAGMHASVEHNKEQM